MVSVDLKVPISVSGAEVRSVTLRVPRVRDLEYAETASKAKMDTVAYQTHLLASVSGLPLDAVRDLSADDFIPLIEHVSKMISGNG